MKFNLCAGLLTLMVLVPCWVRAADTPDIDYMARLLMEAHDTRSLYPDFVRINPRLNDTTLYEIQKRYVALRLEHGDAIAGYKGGFVPRAPIGGVVYQGGMRAGSATIRLEDFRILMVEAEIAFRFCTAVTEPLADVAALMETVCEILPAVELPDTALPDLAALRKNFSHLRKSLIMTNMTSSQLLLGPGRDPRRIDINRLTIRVTYNGAPIGHRQGSTAEGDLWRNVLWVVNAFVLGHGYMIDPGHIIIPGNLTGIHPGKAGDYRVEFGALGAIDFTVAGR